MVGVLMLGRWTLARVGEWLRFWESARTHGAVVSTYVRYRTESRGLKGGRCFGVVAM